MKSKYMFAIIGITLCIVVFYFIYQFNQDNNGLSTIRTLQKYADSTGRIIDVDKTVGVESADDITYRIKDNYVTIFFGKVEIKLALDYLKDQNYLREMRKIGLTVHNQSLYYMGDKIEE